LQNTFKACGTKRYGELAEWSIAEVLKTSELVKGSGGSNPSLTARFMLTCLWNNRRKLVQFLAFASGLRVDTKKSTDLTGC
jgi:hypothetical protein